MEKLHSNKKIAATHDLEIILNNCPIARSVNIFMVSHFLLLPKRHKAFTFCPGDSFPNTGYKRIALEVGKAACDVHPSALSLYPASRAGRIICSSSGFFHL